MALATTCPQCKTSFKVVPDQLKLRRGLVRCGVCQHVFSGVEHLRYVDRDEDASQPDAAAASVQGAPSPLPAATGASRSMARPGHDGLHASAPATGNDQALSPDTLIQDEAADSHTATWPHSAPSGSATEAVDGTTDQPADRPANAAPKAAGIHEQDIPRSGNDRARRRGRNRRRDNRPERAANEASRAAPDSRPARHHAEEDDLKTVFFLSDNEEPLPGQGADAKVQLPASLRSGHTAPQSDDLDPDTQAAGALIDEANRIWRQHKPRQADAPAADDAGKDSSQGHDTPAGHAGTSEGSRHPGSRTGHSRRHRRHGTDGSHTGQNPITGWLTPTRRRRLAIALSVLAAVQLVAVYRTEIAYNLPFLRPVANAASALTGQSIRPPMNLGALSIESFELRNTRQPGRTRMTAILRNRSKLPTRWPAMELTLTGPSNAVVVRKVLLPGQYLANPQAQAGGMPPNSEQPVDLLLETTDLNLAGYSVALFYP